jgi:hypothetical protein
MRFPVPVMVGSASWRSWPTDEGRQNILLDVQVIVSERREEALHRRIVSDVAGSSSR